ncbi:hypothetical protein MLD38_025817 [Melastoma candidum]|uniref:Uncharacterized protein n=1 Tax=Melastoma candidum TaxID=119954 RepID=A0ACB9NZR4_9MYRT|nr:hypothetical protein MLD38_025817 [Melastoma candidum]
MPQEPRAACIEKLLLHCAIALKSNDVTLDPQVMWVLRLIVVPKGPDRPCYQAVPHLVEFEWWRRGSVQADKRDGARCVH